MNTAKQPSARGGVDGAVEAGLEARRAWTRDGVLISTAEFASARGVVPDALVALESRGELFSVLVEDQVWWPAELLTLRAEHANAICRALGNLTDSCKVVFLMRKHGVLGRSVAEAAETGQIAEVVRLAEEWRLH